MSSYSPSNRLVTSTSASGAATYTYSANGAMILVQATDGTTTLQYDKENRLVFHQSGGKTSTYQYSGDSLKRVIELVAGREATTLVWDRLDHLQGRS